MPESWQHTWIMASTTASSPLRRRRLECGLTQAELGARAGVSRQLVAAVEAGHNAPAVDAALGLARALATTVEELFSPPPPEVTAAVGNRLPDHRPLRVGRVGDRLVAAALPDQGIAGATWATPDGVMQDGALRLFAGAAAAGLVLAGCDPALGVAEAMLRGLGPRSLMAVSASTGAALASLAQNRIHAAVVHGPRNELPDPPVRVLRLHLARWQVGLARAPGLKRRRLEDLLRGEVEVAQRDPAAASQQALHRAVKRAGIASPPPGPTAGGHIEAARVAATLGCAAVTTEAAARAFDLSFIPLEEHAVEIWLAERWSDHPGLDALGALLTGTGFIERVSLFGGYDLAGCGERVAR
jgi:DNA-binding XRE family transcriptional regulator